MCVFYFEMTEKLINVYVIHALIFLRFWRHFHLLRSHVHLCYRNTSEWWKRNENFSPKALCSPFFLPTFVDQKIYRYFALHQHILSILLFILTEEKEENSLIFRRKKMWNFVLAQKGKSMKLTSKTRKRCFGAKRGHDCICVCGVPIFIFFCLEEKWKCTEKGKIRLC